MFGKNKNKQPEYTDPISPETGDMLRAELFDIDERLQEIGRQQQEYVHGRMSGQVEDGEHNRNMDLLMSAEQQLQAKREELLARIDRVSSGLAAAALYDHSGE